MLNYPGIKYTLTNSQKMVAFTVIVIIFILKVIDGLVVDKWYKVQGGIVQENFQENIVKSLQFTKRP